MRGARGSGEGGGGAIYLGESGHIQGHVRHKRQRLLYAVLLEVHDIEEEAGAETAQQVRRQHLADAPHQPIEAE